MSATDHTAGGDGRSTGEVVASKRSVRLSADEAWSVVEEAHTGILGTLRRDGVPIMLPVWFVVHEHRIYLRTGADSKKARRLGRDPRASFLVESGERWAELQAVHLTGRVERLNEPADLVALVEDRFDAKYARFRTASARMSTATRSYYAKPRALFCFSPDERILSWDNRRLGLA